MKHFLLIVSTVLAGSPLCAQLVINEVDYDQVGTDTLEYIELLNTGNTPFPLQYVSVVMYNGSSGAGVEYRTLSNPSWPALDPQDRFVICTDQGTTSGCDVEVTPSSNLIQNGPLDAIVLVFNQTPVPTIIDVLSYGGTLSGYSEGNGSSAEDTNLSPGVSIGRYPDGTDTGDNDTDFRFMCSTPGAPNVVDPVQCDLSTGVGSHTVAMAAFTVLLSADGGNILVFDANTGREPLRFELFDSNGALLAAKGAPATGPVSMAFAAERFQGRMVLVRLTTPTRQETRRIVLP